MSSYKNPAIIPPFQSRVALVENLWKPPKSTEFSSLLGAPPQYIYPNSNYVQSYTITHFPTILLIVRGCFLLFDNLLEEVYNTFIKHKFSFKVLYKDKKCA